MEMVDICDVRLSAAQCNIKRSCSVREMFGSFHVMHLIVYQCCIQLFYLNMILHKSKAF